MYPEEIVKPCREELTSVGVKELKTAPEVDKAIRDGEGTTLLVVNSVCGCAAGGARPAVRAALGHGNVPDNLATVFAGVDREAVTQARSYMVGYPPSSPSVALFKDGQLVFIMERHDIEGYPPDHIAGRLKDAFDTHCKKTSSA
ncbi:MAG: BrxA/BrxB family bacilliredoxin [Candidatus Krumholzibacteria bacterium]|nr:BrxA/BrxB family bacilliredoxin [Candidatus Krumholzibacteria bacterium]